MTCTTYVENKKYIFLVKKRGMDWLKRDKRFMQTEEEAGAYTHGSNLRAWKEGTHCVKGFIF